MEKIHHIPGTHDLNQAVVRNDGMVEIWGQNVSSHPWKERNYKEHLVEVISLDEFNSRQEVWQKTAADEREKQAAKDAKKATLDGWLNSLPDTLPNGIGVDKTFKTLTDPYGNPLPISLHQFVGMTAKETAQAIDVEMAEDDFFIE